MSKTPNRMAVERVQWREVFPILRLGSAFRHALQPGKLIVALLAVVLIHFSGSVYDWLWGEAHYAGWVSYLGQQSAALLNEVLHLRLVAGEGGAGAVDRLTRMVVYHQRLFEQAPWFTLLFGADVLFVVALASGVICRMSAMQVCKGRLTGLGRAVAFVARRWLWYLLCPLLPAALAVVLGCVLMLAGLVFFNLPVLDVIGSLLFGVLLILGFVIALVGFVLLFALPLLPPAMSVEGTDAFDAISRAFNYVMYKPWQLAGYLVASLFYLAVVYLLVSMLAGLTIYATGELVGVASFASVDDSYRADTRFQAIVEGSDRHGGSVSTAGWILARWVELVGALVLALIFSVACSLQTQVYVLMRRSADGTPLDDCAQDDEPDPWSSPEDMVDPVAQAFAASGPKGHPTPDDEPPAAGDPDRDSKHDGA